MSSLPPFSQLRARRLFLLPWIVLLPILITTASLLPGQENLQWKKLIMGVEFNTIFGLWIAKECRRYKISINRIIRVEEMTAMTWCLVPCIAILSFMLSIGTAWLKGSIGELLNSEFGPSRIVTWLSYRPNYQTGTFVEAVTLVMLLIIVGPAIEEFLFSGLLLHRWTVKWSVSTAIIASSLLFTLFHMDVLGAFFLSVLMNVVYIRTRTLAVNILVHALHNALVLISGHIVLGNLTAWLGPLSFCFSLPIVLGLTFKYWPKQNSSLPYFSIPDPLGT